MLAQISNSVRGIQSSHSVRGTAHTQYSVFGLCHVYSRLGAEAQSPTECLANQIEGIVICAPLPLYLPTPQLFTEAVNG
jgi:hypothetical protein